MLCISSLTNLVALHWTHSCMRVSSLFWGAEKWTPHSRWDLTSAEGRGRIPSLAMVASLLLAQPRMPFLQRNAADSYPVCPLGPPGCFSAKLSPNQWDLSLSHCMGFFDPRCRAWYLLLLNFMRILSVYSSRLKTCLKSISAFLCIRCFPLFGVIFKPSTVCFAMVSSCYAFLALCASNSCLHGFSAKTLSISPSFSLMMHGLFTYSTSSFTSQLSALSEVCHTGECTPAPAQGLYSSLHMLELCLGQGLQCAGALAAVGVREIPCSMLRTMLHSRQVAPRSFEQVLGASAFLLP